MTSTVVNTTFKGKADQKATYVTTICAMRTPMVSGILFIVSINEYNNCKIIIETCAPYDVTPERDNILGIMEIEEEEFIPLTDDFISSVCPDIHN
jgi:hypothetical protein